MLRDLPNDGHVDVKVFMNGSVSHGNDLAPGYDGMGLTIAISEMTSRFTNDLELAHNAILKQTILYELGVGDAL